MQVKVYLKDSRVVVDLCTSESPRVGSFHVDALDESDEDEPIVLNYPDITGSTIFSRPYGEMSSAEQDRTIALREQQRDNALREEGKEPPGHQPHQSAPGSGGFERPVGDAASSAATENTFAESREGLKNKTE